MQSVSQWEVDGKRAGVNGQGKPSRPLRIELIEMRRQAHYWRSQHARAKERIAGWRAQWKAARGELADALHPSSSLFARLSWLAVVHCVEFSQNPVDLRQIL